MSLIPALIRLLAQPDLAIGEDAIVCLICGRTFGRLTVGHLRTHGTAAGEYRARFGYSSADPLTCHGLRRRSIGTSALERRA